METQRKTTRLLPFTTQGLCPDLSRSVLNCWPGLWKPPEAIVPSAPVLSGATTLCPLHCRYNSLFSFPGTFRLISHKTSRPPGVMVTSPFVLTTLSVYRFGDRGRMWRRGKKT